MTYQLGQRSINELEGVHPKLVAVTHRAITTSPIDFGVFDGIRTKPEQAEFVATGVSQTMDSKHLPQPDGFGHAVDLVPYIGRKYRWEEEPLCTLAEFMRLAAIAEGVKLRWGGAWCNLTDTSEDPRVLIDKYRALRHSQGRKPFVDAPHYELVL